MRFALIASVTLALVTPGLAQDQPTPPIRYELAPQLLVYSQATPKETLASAIKLIERQKFDYLAAQIIDYKFIDSKVRERAVPLEEAIEASLRAQREVERQDPLRYPLGTRLPDDPDLFRKLVIASAQQRAFRLVVRDVRANFEENPDHLKEFRIFLRGGVFNETGDTASCTFRDFKDRAVYFRKIGGFWTIEDRQKPNSSEKP